MLQQLNRQNTVVKDDSTTMEKTHMIPRKSGKFPSQQHVNLEFPTTTPFISHVLTEKQKIAFIRLNISSTENPI